MEPSVEAGRLVRRNVLPLVDETLADTPITIIQGARQVGKSTLAQMVVDARAGVLVSLDEPGAVESARRDPDGFLDQGDGRLFAIDEVQRVPELVRALKASVDADRRPGRFLVTGSADLLNVPGVSDSLAGRAETVPLFGLSQGELIGVREDFVDRVAAGGTDWLARRASSIERQTYAQMVCAGGYPEALGREGSARRRWFEYYLYRIVRRDAVDVSRLQHIDRLARLLRLVAANDAGELVRAHLARDADIPETPLSPYLALLEHLYLVHWLPAWGHNLTKRVVGRPKLALLDTGLAVHLMGRAPRSLAVPPGSEHLGGLLEGFVGAELRKQQSWSAIRYGIHHFRDRDGLEVDIVRETAAGQVIGLEVKAAKTVHARDFKGLELLRARCGDAFVAGVLLHPGTRSFPFGDRLWSTPLDALWT